MTPLLWWQVLIGVFAMHLMAGYIVTLVFQMAHIVEGVDQPLTNADGDVENAWAIHQLHTTANFARDNRFLNWYVGGLNFQIEHHLFPKICHVHYRRIAQIVEQTAERIPSTLSSHAYVYPRDSFPHPDAQIIGSSGECLITGAKSDEKDGLFKVNIHTDKVLIFSISTCFC